MTSLALRRFAVTVAAAATLGSATAAAAQTYEGDWAGVLKAPGDQQLHLILHVKSQGGQLSAVVDSPDQGASIPAGSVKVEGGKLDVLFPDIMGELKADLAPDGKSITGVWSQGMELPIVMTKVDGAAKH